MDTVTWILGGIVLSLCSGLIGKYLGTKGNITDNCCIERRKSCTAVLGEQISNLHTNITELRQEIKELRNK